MNNQRQTSPDLLQREIWSNAAHSASDANCELDEEGHCITCSDEALPAHVLRVDEQSGVAFVTIKGAMEEVDITLLDDVAPGNLLLVHGGVAISKVADEAAEVSNG